MLVQFKGSPAAASIATAQARAPLPGLALAGLVGKHHQRRVMPGGGGGRVAAAAAPDVPPDAIMRFRVTDGKSAEAKAAQLLKHDGGSLIQRAVGGDDVCNYQCMCAAVQSGSVQRFRVD